MNSATNPFTQSNSIRATHSFPGWLKKHRKGSHESIVVQLATSLKPLDAQHRFYTMYTCYEHFLRFFVENAKGSAASVVMFEVAWGHYWDWLMGVCREYTESIEDEKRRAKARAVLVRNIDGLASGWDKVKLDERGARIKHQELNDKLRKEY